MPVYIGSHTALCLLEAGHEEVVIDNLVNSQFGSLPRVQQLGQEVDFHAVDLLNARLSPAEVPEATVWVDVDATAVVELRASLKKGDGGAPACSPSSPAL